MYTMYWWTNRLGFLPATFNFDDHYVVTLLRELRHQWELGSHGRRLPEMRKPIGSCRYFPQKSLDWCKGKFTGNQGFYHQIDRVFWLKFSHNPILWKKLIHWFKGKRTLESMLFPPSNYRAFPVSTSLNPKKNGWVAVRSEICPQKLHMMSMVAWEISYRISDPSLFRKGLVSLSHDLGILDITLYIVAI